MKHWSIQALQKCKDVLHDSRALQEQQLQFEPLVIKVLRDYHDTRYNLDTLEKRQRCQIEALRLNRAFTPEVYLGLARINRDVYDWSKKSLQLGEILPSPSLAMLDPNAEYALVMRRLPDQRRLDLLLQAKDEVTLQLYMHMLAKHVADMHEPLPPISRKAIWGSYEQLQGKLLHNFALLDLVLTKDSAYASLKNRLTTLKETLKQIFMQSSYRDYFQQRVNRPSIKHCHGDLKAPNIWILSEEERRQEKKPVRNLAILDAADFNPSYTNIDVLSDIAMLIVDVQVRTRSADLAELLLQTYLRYTGQQDRVSQAVLAYYLVEKAIVGVAVSLVYDDLSALGLAFLAVAEERLRGLQRFNSSRHQKVQKDRYATYNPDPAQR